MDSSIRRTDENSGSRQVPDQQHPPPRKCPRCESNNTKFCYYNNYSHSQPRYFCKACRRYWTHGGTLRNVPVGGGCRKNKRTKTALSGAGSNETATANQRLPSPPTLESSSRSFAGRFPGAALIRPAIPPMGSFLYNFSVGSQIGGNLLGQPLVKPQAAAVAPPPFPAAKGGNFQPIPVRSLTSWTQRLACGGVGGLNSSAAAAPRGGYWSCADRGEQPAGSSSGENQLRENRPGTNYPSK